jgi:cell division protein FtsL
VDRLQKHVEALYQLPAMMQTGMSPEDMGGMEGLLGQGGANVNDMWQIIQLNNRVASCESAIQKVGRKVLKLSSKMSLSVSHFHSVSLINSACLLSHFHFQMATLIEDLAMDLSQLKGDHHTVRSDADRLSNSYSKLSLEMGPLPEQCQVVQAALNKLKGDLKNIRDEVHTLLLQQQLSCCLKA